MDPKRQSIKKYFTSKFPKWALVLAIFGALVALGGMSTSFVALLFGIALVAGGVFAIVNAGNVVSDQQIDMWTQEDIGGLNKRALEKMGTDASELVSEPVMITGPRLEKLGPAQFGYRKGKDNILRFTPVDTAVVNFTQNQLLVYRCAADLMTGNPVNESTDEYFYRDVVSVQTDSASMTVKLPGFKELIQLNGGDSFKLTTSGGTSVRIILRDPSLIQKMGGGEIPTTAAERAIQTIRRMLRDKKSTGAGAA